ncbi:PREDICTED: ADP-ribosylation factor-related protein 1 isoform X2 [Mandrillus leucophaeus]|uniref:ADP-ribosylation factor-related protein 1 isoform X2 n=1 Tax=Mandrillus leucophaeus TaxID=9568 RepID=UPI0005F43FC9|nr:PREDICTED: ADP-ribosylation factor-related protein 1 isoform X2 [Mandrillus leucophaeus]XP_025254166.1 ADP-ribosylation factor-related protein 1 isoform X2 [Theropithecus gelada]
MYTLLSGLYKYMFQKDEYCILILGLDNAGKTTFLEQSKTRFNKNYKGMSLSKITTTVGLNIGTVDVGKARLMFWDLGGQEELQSLWDKYYAECHGVIYVIDSTDEERLAESKQAFEGGDQRGAVRCPCLGAGQQAGCGGRTGPDVGAAPHGLASPRRASQSLTSRRPSATAPARSAGGIA